MSATATNLHPIMPPVTKAERRFQTSLVQQAQDDFEREVATIHHLGAGEAARESLALETMGENLGDYALALGEMLAGLDTAIKPKLNPRAHEVAKGFRDYMLDCAATYLGDEAWCVVQAAAEGRE